MLNIITTISDKRELHVTLSVPGVPTRIAPVPLGDEDWSDGLMVLAPITRADGKIIWNDILINFVNELNASGWAIHPKEDIND